MSRWYKRCGADFIHGTMSLSLEEKGAYSLCLDLIYDRGEPIADDARWLSGICGVSIRRWKSIRQTLLDLGKLYACDGVLSNARADFEIVSAEFRAKKQAESGAKGGRKRAENAVALNENKDLAQASLKPIDKIREDKKREEEYNNYCLGTKTPRARDAPDGAGAPCSGDEGYAFAGRVIRLKADDYQRWRKAYPAVNLMAALQSRDDWIRGQPENDRRAWFHSTSRDLEKRQQAAEARLRAEEREAADICPPDGGPIYSV